MVGAVDMDESKRIGGADHDTVYVDRHRIVGDTAHLYRRRRTASRSDLACNRNQTEQKCEYTQSIKSIFMGF
jgi:hypothetical protein